MINGELSVFLLTCMSPNTNVTHGIKAKLVSFRSFGMYLSFESKRKSLRQSADSQSTKYSVSELMVDPVVPLAILLEYRQYCVRTIQGSQRKLIAFSLTTLNCSYTPFTLIRNTKCLGATSSSNYAFEVC